MRTGKGSISSRLAKTVTTKKAGKTTRWIFKLQSRSGKSFSFYLGFLRSFRERWRAANFPEFFRKLEYFRGLDGNGILTRSVVSGGGGIFMYYVNRRGRNKNSGCVALWRAWRAQTPYRTNKLTGRCENGTVRTWEKIVAISSNF